MKALFRAAGKKVWNIASAPLCVVLLIPLCIFAYRFAAATIPDSRNPDFQFQSMIRELVKRDPPVGTKSGIKDLDRSRKTLVIYASRCSCHKSNIEALRSLKLSEANIRVMMPVEGYDQKLADSLAEVKELVMYDTGKIVGTRLNMTFVPRVFILDEGGGLLWVYPEYEESWKKLFDAARQELEKHHAD